MENIIAQPLYLWAFQTKREQLKLYFPYRTEKHPIIPTELYNMIVGKKQRIDILMKSHLSVILAKKLVGNNKLYPRFPRFHAQRILTRQHYFQDIKCVATLVEHSDRVYSVALNSTAPHLATCSNDGTSKLWCFSAEGCTSGITCVATLPAYFIYSIVSIAFHPTEPFLATGSEDNTAKLWRLTANGCITGATCVATLAGHSNSIFYIAFHPTLPLLATGSNDNTTKLWRFSADGSTATCVATLAGHSNGVVYVAFHPTAPLLATGSFDNTAKLWCFSPDGCTSDMTCVATLEGHKGYVLSVAFHPTEPLLATGSADNTVKLWR